MRISDWSSDVCSSDLLAIDVADAGLGAQRAEHRRFIARPVFLNVEPGAKAAPRAAQDHDAYVGAFGEAAEIGAQFADQSRVERIEPFGPVERRDQIGRAHV